MQKDFIYLNDEYFNIGNLNEAHIASKTAYNLYTAIITHLKTPQEVLYSLTNYFYDEPRVKIVEEYFYYCVACVELHLWHDFASSNPRVRRLARSIDSFLLYYLSRNYTISSQLIVNDITESATVELKVLQNRLREYNTSYTPNDNTWIDPLKARECFDAVLLQKIGEVFDWRLNQEEGKDKEFVASDFKIFKQELIDSIRPLEKKIDRFFNDFAVSLFYLIP